MLDPGTYQRALAKRQGGGGGGGSDQMYNGQLMPQMHVPGTTFYPEYNVVPGTTFYPEEQEVVPGTTFYPEQQQQPDILQLLMMILGGGQQ